MTALIEDEMSVFAVLCAVAAAVFLTARQEWSRPVMRYVPPVVWLYFIPMILTSVGVTPSQSPLYRWMAKYLLPFSLFLLTMSINLRALASIGRPAALMLLAGTLGVSLGVIAAFIATEAILPANSWQGLSMLAASWIGGSANMLAMQQNLEADPSLFGPVIVTDTIISYGWLGAVIFAGSYQLAFDRWLGGRQETLAAVDLTLAADDGARKPVRFEDVMLLIAAAFAIAIVARSIADALPPLGDPVIISASTWTVVMVVTLGLGLSMTRLSRARDFGAADFGYVGLYLLFPAVGAQADLRAITQAPQFLIPGLIMIVAHLGVLTLAARLMRLPSFFIAVGSIANIGGAASAPIAAAAYRPALAPVGALMGVAGYILGIYAPVLVSAVLSLLAK